MPRTLQFVKIGGERYEAGDGRKFCLEDGSQASVKSIEVIDDHTVRIIFDNAREVVRSGIDMQQWFVNELEKPVDEEEQREELERFREAVRYTASARRAEEKKNGEASGVQGGKAKRTKAKARTRKGTT